MPRSCFCLMSNIMQCNKDRRHSAMNALSALCVLQSAERGAWRDLRERGSRRLVLVDSIEQGIQAATYTYGATFLSERDRVSPLVQSPPHNCLLAQVPVNILRLPASFLLQKNSPYKSAIDQQ
jgi:hypothetical protein